MVVAFLQAAEQGQAVHPRHVDVAQHHVDRLVVAQRGQGVHPIVGECEAELPVADLPAEALDDQQFQVGLVIDDEDACGHPLPLASATTTDTSRFSCGKSTGLVMNLLAPRSSAIVTLSGSP